MIYFTNHLSCFGNMLVINDICYVMNRRTGHTVSSKQGNDIFSRMLFGPTSDHRIQFIFLICPIFIQLKTFISKPIFMFGSFAKTFPDSIITNPYDNPFIRGFKRIIGINKFITVASAFRNTSLYHINFSNGFHCANRTIDKADINVFTVMLRIPALQCC